MGGIFQIQRSARRRLFRQYRAYSKYRSFYYAQYKLQWICIGHVRVVRLFLAHKHSSCYISIPN